MAWDKKSKLEFETARAKSVPVFRAEDVGSASPVASFRAEPASVAMEGHPDLVDGIALKLAFSNGTTQTLFLNPAVALKLAEHLALTVDHQGWYQVDRNKMAVVPKRH